MDPASNDAATPIALARDEGETLWFLGFLATIKASAESTGGRVAVIEQRAAQGAGSPLHDHHREGEWFYVLEGELAIWAGGQLAEASAGSFVYGPPDVPHTFTVTSPEARFLVGAEPAGFEGFVRAVAEPAQTRTIPSAGPPPDPAWMSALAAQYGMEILGPPGIPS